MKNVIRIGSASAVVTAFLVASLSLFNPALAVTTTTSATASVPIQVYVRTTTPVYSTPSTTGLMEGQLLAGQVWFVLGTDATGNWVQVQIPSNSGLPSWVPANTLALDGIILPLSSLVTPVATGTLTTTEVPVTVVASTSTLSTSPTATASSAASATSISGTPAPITLPFLTTVTTTTNVYDMPSTSGVLEGQLIAGQTWFVLGEDATGKWIQVQIPSDSGLPSWVPADTLAVSGLNIPLSPLVTPVTPSAATFSATLESTPTLDVTTTLTATP